MAEVIYIPAKIRIWDMKHIRDYIKELDKWEGEDVSSSFPYLRKAIKLWDTEKKNIQDMVPGANKIMKGETVILRQYIKKKDREERLTDANEKSNTREKLKEKQRKGLGGILEDIEGKLAAIEKLLQEKKSGRKKGK